MDGRLTRARTDDEWNRLRVDLSALATRYNLHRRLDAALGRATQPQPREPTRGAESARRAASEEERSRTLSGRLRDLLGLDGPEALVTYPEARVPPKVELRTSFHLEVVAHPTPTAASPTALELTRKKRGPVNLDVEVRLPPGGAIEARGALTHPLRVPEGQESPRLSFPLFARALGKHPIEVDFKEKGISRLTLSCTTEVVEAQTDPLPATAPTVTSDALIAGAAAFRGLRLVLTPNDRHDPPRSFHVALVRHGVPGLDMIEANIHLPEGAPQLVVRLAGELGPRSLYAQYDTAEARESHLRRLGEQLAAIILPEPVASALAAAPEGAALHIESSDLWVPWELARLPLPKDDRAFLGEWFAVTRWLGPYPLRDHLPGGRPVLVAPTSSGVSSADERRALQELTGRPPEELCSFQEVQDLLHRSPVSSGRPAPSCGILHFLCHGRAEPDRPLAGLLALDGGALRPAHVPGARRAGAVLQDALVFINACEADVPGPSLLGHGHWAQAFLGAGAAAVVAPSWRVAVSSAATFATRLYRDLGNNEPLGSAARAARCAAASTGNPSRLAYAVYASPFARMPRRPSARRPGGSP